MGRIAIPAIVWVLAVAVMAAAYLGAPHAGIHIDAENAMAFAAIGTFATSLAVFTLVARNASGSLAMPYQKTRLSEMPAAQKVSLFKDSEKLQVVAKPDMSVGEILVKHGDVFKSLPENMDKRIVLTIKGSKKSIFNPITLKQLFESMSPFKLEHVLLMNDDKFVGYIPGERAVKEFTGKDAETNIANYIVKVLGKAENEDVLRKLDGVTSDDTVDEKDNIRHAVIKFYANDSVPGLVVHRQLQPVGYITKVDLLTLTSTEPIIANL
jgi:hypothetical protein